MAVEIRGDIYPTTKYNRNNVSDKRLSRLIHNAIADSGYSLRNSIALWSKPEDKHENQRWLVNVIYKGNISKGYDKLESFLNSIGYTLSVVPIEDTSE